MIKIGIMGGSSPIAGELIRLLIHHPDADIIWVNSRSMAAGAISDVHAGMHGDTELRFSSGYNLAEVNLVFLCSTPGETEDFLKENPEIPDKLRLIDLSGYCMGTENFIYGLPELYRKTMVRGGTRVAIPGAIATVLQLALLPLAKNLMLNCEIFATGITPQSDRPAMPNFAAAAGNICLDRPLRHPQAEEAVANLSTLQSSYQAPIQLVSMRGPQSRGTMVSLLLDAATDLQHLRELYDNFYDDHNFVYLTDRPVELKDVVNTNKCLIHLQKFDGRLLISAAIDNLLKGGAGTAVHCMNLLFGLAERTGLTLKTSSYF
ncbi:MAG: N-acetyl-gamma-glutamyl-phosphate reductase [Muribaculaceae bacterium]|nr:N-acetyl-gamma-glutamyl-phosphate reductase [Muribaculaceae bacterium]